MDDAEIKTAPGHIVLIGDIAGALSLSPDLLDEIGGPDVRVTRTVLRSELLRALAAGPLDLIITASNAAFVDSDRFIAAFSARVVPVAMLIVARRLDEKLLLRLRAGAVEPELLTPPVDHAALRERVRRSLSQRRLRSIPTRDPLPDLVARARDQLGTYTLHVSAGAEHGSLTFLDGALVAAQNARLIGDRAALEILGWRHTSVVVDGAVSLAAHAVTSELDALLSAVRPPADRGTDPPGAPAAPEAPAAPGAPAAPTEASSDSKTTRPRIDSDRKGQTMANVNKTLEETMKIDGAIGAAIADWESGLCLGMIGGGSRLNIEVAAAGNCQVVKAKMATMMELGIKGAIQDILITLDDQIHLLRPLRRGESMFVYLAIDKAKGNLAMARHRLTKLESELTV
jgi:hypothetical protein